MPLPAPLKYNSVRDRLFRCPRFVKLSTAGNKLKFKLQQVTYSVHELVISHGNMEKLLIFLETRHKLFSPIQYHSCPWNATRILNSKKKKKKRNDKYRGAKMYMISLTIQLQLALHRERICRSVICQVFQTMYMKKKVSLSFIMKRSREDEQLHI